MKLRERVRMLDHHFRRERPCLHVAPLLELQQVPAVTEHRTLSQSFEDSLFTTHHALPSVARPATRPTEPSVAILQAG